MLEHKNKFVPKEGFNLVGVDDFEEPGEELYLVGHFDSREEAEAFKAKRLKADPNEVLHVYDPES